MLTHDGVTARAVNAGTARRTDLDGLADRDTGAASTESRKPSLRSWMSDIIEKIEVNNTIMATEPGKK